jgi:hypothetical protein
MVRRGAGGRGGIAQHRANRSRHREGSQDDQQDDADSISPDHVSSIARPARQEPPQRRELHQGNPSFSGAWTARDLVIDCELADVKTTDQQVLYSKRAHMPSLQSQRSDDHASNRQGPDGRGPERQSADRNRTDGCSPD